jgi:SulP family sulfate permease
MKPAQHAAAARKIIPNLAAGTLSALVTLSYATSYGAMIFSADLRDHLAAGMPVALTGCWVVALIVALGSSFRFAVGGPDSNATAVLAMASASIASRATAAGASGESVLATVAMFLSVSAILTGLILYAMGAMKWGRLVRFVPHPVVGGFLAGTGYLILDGAFRVAAGKPLSIEALAAIGKLHWLGVIPALVVAVALLIVPRFWKPFFLTPMAIILGSLVFYAGMLASGATTAECRALGLLFDPLKTDAWSSPFAGRWSLVRWEAILPHVPEFAAMTVVTVITILLNATGLDLATGEDADFDKELRAAGVANALSGLAGGMVGYQSISRSLLNFRAGATGRTAGIWCAILCFAAATIFPGLFSYFPRPVLAGLLLYLGLSLLIEWAVLSYGRLPRREYMLILLILVLIAWKGFIAGVAFGVVVACVLFAFSYSRTSCIKYDFTGATRSSNVERPIEHVEALKAEGDRIYGLCLQGFLFFGTSNAILDKVKERADRGRPMKYVLLDFLRVNGLDASAALAFAKLRQFCVSRGATLCLTGMDDVFRRTLLRGGALSEGAREFEDTDRALEWAEEQILSELFSDDSTAGNAGLEKRLATHFSPENLEHLLAALKFEDVPKGAFVFRKGDDGGALYFVESGRVSVRLPLDDGGSVRLRAFGAGTIFGEMGLYSGLPRSADVVADCPSRIGKLTREKLDRLTGTFPAAAIQLHNFVVRVLAVRLAAANEEIRSLL